MRCLITDDGNRLVKKLNKRYNKTDMAIKTVSAPSDEKVQEQWDKAGKGEFL